MKNKTINQGPGLWLRIVLLACCIALGAARAQTPPGMQETQVPAQAFVRGVPAPAWFAAETQFPTAGGNEPLVSRVALTHFRVDDGPRVVVQRAIQAHEAGTLPEIGQYPIVFHPDFQKVELHSLRVHRRGEILDRMASAGIRFLHTEFSAEHGIYTGTVTAIVVVSDVRQDDTLEIVYSLVGANPVLGQRFVDAASWDNPSPILLRRVLLDSPAARKVDYRVLGQPLITAPQERQEGGRRVLMFEGRNLPGVPAEPMVPPDAEPYRWIQFSEFGSWAEVTQWAEALFAPPKEEWHLPDSIRGTTPEERLLSALRFVQEDIRYLSLSIGENSHRPAAPAEVLARRFGDCKDKSLLLVSLLQRLGIRAEPVLLSARQRKGLSAYLPSSAVFDHVIVRATLAGQVYYLDPTMQGQGGTLNSLTPPWPDVDVLPVQAGNTGLTHIAVRSQPTQPLSRRVETVTVTDMEQPVSLVLESRYLQDHADYARRTLANLGSAQIRKMYEGMLDHRYPQAQLTEGPTIKDDRAGNELLVRTVFRVPNFFEKQGNRWTLRYEAGNLVDVLPVPASGKRSQAIYIGAAPWLGRYVMEVNLPQSFDGRYEPDVVKLDFAAFHLEQKASFSGRKLMVEDVLNLSKDRIGADAASQYLQDLRKASPYIKGALYVSEQDKAKSALGEPEVPLRELSRQRLEQVLKATAQALANARSSGGDLAGPACEHALASAYLGQDKTALQDAEDAVNEQPAAADPLVCRGKVRVIMGDFDAGIRDMTRALSFGANDSDLWLQRGLAYLYTGQKAKAAVDFQAYGSKVSDAHARARARIWQWFADGKAAGGDDQVWPAPMLAVLQGRQSGEEAVDKLLQRESGHRQTEELAEAYFYLARFNAAQNPAKAKAYLERCLELAPYYSIVRIAANHERRQMLAGTPSGAGKTSAVPSGGKP